MPGPKSRPRSLRCVGTERKNSPNSRVHDRVVLRGGSLLAKGDYGITGKSKVDDLEPTQAAKLMWTGGNAMAHALPEGTLIGVKEGGTTSRYVTKDKTSMGNDREVM
jgi:hypothetical protein